VQAVTGEAQRRSFIDDLSLDLYHTTRLTTGDCNKIRQILLRRGAAA